LQIVIKNGFYSSSLSSSNLLFNSSSKHFSSYLVFGLYFITATPLIISFDEHFFVSREAIKKRSIVFKNAVIHWV